MLPHMKKKKEKREGKRPARERPEERARQLHSSVVVVWVRIWVLLLLYHSLICGINIGLGRLLHHVVIGCPWTLAWLLPGESPLVYRSHLPFVVLSLVLELVPQVWVLLRDDPLDW